MIARTGPFLLGAVALGAVVVVRHVRGTMGRPVPGGILIGDAAVYDAATPATVEGPAGTG